MTHCQRSKWHGQLPKPLGNKHLFQILSELVKKRQFQGVLETPTRPIVGVGRAILCPPPVGRASSRAGSSAASPHQKTAHGVTRPASRIPKFAIRNSHFSRLVSGVHFGMDDWGNTDLTQRRKAAKRQRKLAGDNVPGKMPIDDSSRRDDGNGRMIPPSLQDGFRFGR